MADLLSQAGRLTVKSPTSPSPWQSTCPPCSQGLCSTPWLPVKLLGRISRFWLGLRYGANICAIFISCHSLFRNFFYLALTRFWFGSSLSARKKAPKCPLLVGRTHNNTNLTILRPSQADIFISRRQLVRQLKASRLFEQEITEFSQAAAPPAQAVVCRLRISVRTIHLCIAPPSHISEAPPPSLYPPSSPPSPLVRTWAWFLN